VTVYESLEDFKKEGGWLDVISYGTTDEYPETRGWRAWEGVREIVQNSLPYEEPLLILHNGRIQLVEIGKFVDENLDNDREGYCKGDFYALSFVPNKNDKGYLLKWQKINKVFRHPFQGDMYEIITVQGRKIYATGGHTIFKLWKPYMRKEGVGSHLVAVPTSELKKGDYIAIPSKKLFKLPVIEKFDMLEILAEASEASTENIVIKGATKYFDELGIPIEKDWRKCDSIPFNFWRKFNVPLPNNVQFAYKRSHQLLDRFLDSGTFLYLLGLYMAEGSYAIKNDVKWLVLSLGAHEKDLINDVIDISSQFGLKATVCHPHRTAVNIEIHSPLAIVLTEVFGIGHSATDKRIPDIIFNIPWEQQKIFLKGWIDGDGYKHTQQNRYVLATSSKKALEGLQYLLTLNRIPYSVRVIEPRKRIINGREVHYGVSYCVYIYGLFSREPKKCSPFIKNTKGELTFLEIKDIKRVNYDGVWVYDISVPGTENFVAGSGCICVHNSLDEMQATTGVASYKTEVTSEGIEISDSGRGIGIHNLLMGSSEKPTWARGRFGEGLKVGLMTLLARGYEPEIYSGSYYIKPMFIDMKFKTAEPPYYIIERIFVIAYKKIHPPVEGTIVKIKGLFDDYRERFAVNLGEYVIFSQEVRDAGKIFYRQILNLGRGPKKIFVKDIYVCDADSIITYGKALYSYNLVWVNLDESRRIPVSAHVFFELGKLYADCDIYDVWVSVLEVLKAEKDDYIEYHMELPAHIDTLSVQNTIKSAWDVVFGSDAVLVTDRTLEKFVDWLGYKAYRLPWCFTEPFKKFMRTDKSEVKEFHEMKRGRIPEEEYGSIERARLEAAKIIADELCHLVYGGTPPSIEIWNLPPGVKGEHHPGLNRIVIARAVILDGTLYDFLETLMHELTHYYTGAEDGTSDMIRELGLLAGHVAEILITHPEILTKIRRVVF